jgi:ribosomal protein S18 acetylase RimI-like enzyme
LLAVALQVEAASGATPELEKALASLMPQLNPALIGPTLAELAAVIADPATTLLVASEDGVIVAVAAVIVYTTPVWVKKARIEDVVVDKGVRGRGIGEALVRECLSVARRHGAKVVELQSARRREVANRLYPRLGFERRESNVYRMTL